MTRLTARVTSHLFPPVPAARLAALRLVTGAWALYYVGRRRRMLERVARTDATLFSPVGPVRVLSGPIAPNAFRAVYLSTLIANLAFVAGVRHRYSGPVFAGLLLWLLSYRNSWSMIYHNDNLLVLHVLALGMSPAADALSVDSMSPRAGHSRLTARRRRAPHWRYGWPIQLMNAVTALTYFLAGVAKLRGPLGRRWATGESLRSQVAVDGLRKELLGSEAAPLGTRLYERVGLYRMMAVGSLIVELGAPFMLANRLLSRIWAINAFGMHWGIYFTMGIRFRYQLSGLVFAPFFDVERLALRLAGK